jgi:hypothetical protein
MPVEMAEKCVLQIKHECPGWGNLNKVIAGSRYPMLEQSQRDVRLPQRMSFRTVVPKTAENPGPAKEWTWCTRPGNMDYVAGLKAMATKGLKPENAFDDVRPPGYPDVKPIDEDDPMPEWRVKQVLDELYERKLLRDGPGYAGKKRRVHGDLTVGKMLEELKLQEATYKGLDVALPGY